MSSCRSELQLATFVCNAPYIRFHTNKPEYNEQILNKGHRQLRKGRHSLPGTYYFLTLSIIEKESILVNAEIADIIFESFEWLESNDRLSLINPVGFLSPINYPKVGAFWKRACPCAEDYLTERLQNAPTRGVDR